VEWGAVAAGAGTSQGRCRSPIACLRRASGGVHGRHGPIQTRSGRHAGECTMPTARCMGQDRHRSPVRAQLPRGRITRSLVP
jgi:hypothetical protein